MVQFTSQYASPQELLNILVTALPQIDPMAISPNKKQNNYPWNYYHSYPHFLQFFADRREISVHDFYISSNFIYGWMPTILYYAVPRIPQTVELLNMVKRGNSLSPDQLEVIKLTIHNSLVGASKLLHFINPDLYAMWDSNICLQFYGKNTDSVKGNVQAYLKYVAFLTAAQHCTGFEKYLTLYRTHFHSPDAKPLRALENVLFHLGKLK